MIRIKLTFSVSKAYIFLIAYMNIKVLSALLSNKNWMLNNSIQYFFIAEFVNVAYSKYNCYIYVYCVSNKNFLFH